MEGVQLRMSGTLQGAGSGMSVERPNRSDRSGGSLSGRSLSGRQVRAGSVFVFAPLQSLTWRVLATSDTCMLALCTSYGGVSIAADSAYSFLFSQWRFCDLASAVLRHLASKIRVRQRADLPPPAPAYHTF